MSQLNLSTKLVNDLQGIIAEHDEAARDPGVTSQYLMAVVGFLLGQQDMPSSQKHELLDELSAFARHVVDDVDRQRQQAAAAPPPPPAQEAFGIWTPKD